MHEVKSYHQQVAQASTPLAFSIRRGFRLMAIPEWWHLLSLDAPTVAALWSWSMAKAAHVPLPHTAPGILALGTWLVYVGDRILDGFGQPNTRMQQRHYFYATWREIFLIAAIPASALLLWMVAHSMTTTARREDIALFLVALLYFCLIHLKGPTVEQWLPKELTVGVVFACATAVPAWSRLSAPQRPLLGTIIFIFAALCWLNCVAIQKWEHSQDSEAPTHPSTQWAQRKFLPLCCIIATLALLAATALPLTMALLLIACALTAGLFFALDLLSKRLPFTTLQLRAAADAALLTPFLFLAALKLPGLR